MFKVETYKNPMRFFNSIEIRSDELHITSIPTLAMHLKKLASQKDAAGIWNVWIYHHFFKAVYSNWSTVNVSLRQKQIIRRLIAQYPYSSEKINRVLNKQIEEICKAFRMWVEMGLEEICTVGNDTELEKAYAQLYGHFLEEAENKRLIEELKKPLSTREIGSILDEYNAYYMKKRPFPYSEIKRIYIYCMELLEPSRMTFFKKLDRAGFEVIFRIPDSKEESVLYECWHGLYEKLVPVEKWQSIQEAEEIIPSALQSFLEGKSIEDKVKRPIKFHEMNEPIFFKRYLKEHPMEKRESLEALNREYVACMTDEINEYFRDEIYHTEEIRHFYDTPLGKFISHLYELKLSGEGDFFIDYASFMDMLISGMVCIKASNDMLIDGKRAIGLLSDLEGYMDGVKTLEDIVNRMEAYKLLNSVSDEFEELGRSKADRNRVKRYLQNPFRALGYINHNKYDITSNQLYELTLKLKEIISRLRIEYTPEQDLQGHIACLQGYLEESKVLLQEEDEQNESLLKAYKVFEDVLCHRLKDNVIEQAEDMKDYIAIATKIGSEEEEAGDLVLVKSLEHLPALCVNGVQEIYLCDLSTKHMNTYINNRSKIGYLVSLSDLSKYISRMPEGTQKEELKQSIQLAESSAYHVQNFIKYAITSLFTYYKGELHLGWIKNMQPYDTEWYLLNVIKNLSNVQEIIEDNDFVLDLEDEIVQEKHEAFPVGDLAQQLSPLAWSDLKICDKRFYLSNILNHYPVYLEEFTQREYFAQLCRILEDQHGGRNAVKEFIDPLFPQWSEALKQNLVETHFAKKMNQYMVFDNVHFPESMLNIQCFNAKAEEIKEMKNRSLADKESKLKRWAKDNSSKLQVHPSKACYMCPHQMTCQEGRLAVATEFR